MTRNRIRRRKTRERRTLTDREERRKRSYLLSTSTLPQPAEEQQPRTSTGQVCFRSKDIRPVEG